MGEEQTEQKRKRKDLNIHVILVDFSFYLIKCIQSQSITWTVARRIHIECGTSSTVVFSPSSPFPVVLLSGEIVLAFPAVYYSSTIFIVYCPSSCLPQESVWNPCE